MSETNFLASMFINIKTLKQSEGVWGFRIPLSKQRKNINQPILNLRRAIAMTNIVVNVKVKLKVKGVAGLFALLLGVYGVHHAQPYGLSPKV